MSTLRQPLIASILVAGGLAMVANTSVGAPFREAFPVAVQFSPLPAGDGVWTDQAQELTPEILRATVDDIQAHGVSGLDWPAGLEADSRRVVEEYAVQKGMFFVCHPGATEGFGRNAPPDPPVHSAAYADRVRELARQRTTWARQVPNLYAAFCFQDEPFHWGADALAYDEVTRRAFAQRYGYDMPLSLDAARRDPRIWLDFLNFQSDLYAHGWRQAYHALKAEDPSLRVILTHDSHNTFGGGCGSHTDFAIDDVFHWGGDFADLFVFDIYPYMSLDFRFGEIGQLVRPRMSQTHYSMAQMRNLGRAHARPFGFWVGSFAPDWFGGFYGEELRALYWSEREMATTAVANGADFLLTGIKIPRDARHWDSFGEGLRLIQRIGGRLLDMPRHRARACMLFPRTQYLQLQREYFNVGLSFELSLRAFGELDILHEEQVNDASLHGYEVLLLFDVDLLPDTVARRIAEFVHRGGTVIADCVPHLDELRRPSSVLREVFGVTDSAPAIRIPRSGHWVCYREREPVWVMRDENAPDEVPESVGRATGRVADAALDLQCVSLRPFVPAADGNALMLGEDGEPMALHRRAGEGHAFLLGFCVQDTYFQAWKEDDGERRGQLRALMRGLTTLAGVRSHVWCSNPEIEAAVRGNPDEAVVFLINHEGAEADCTVELADLGFRVGRITDLGVNGNVGFELDAHGVVRFVSRVPLGETRLLRVTPDV